MWPCCGGTCWPRRPSGAVRRKDTLFIVGLVLGLLALMALIALGFCLLVAWLYARLFA